MNNSMQMENRILRTIRIVNGLLFFLIILSCYRISQADPIELASLILKNQEYAVRSETIRVVTAYNAGDPRQTDDTPCIAANGENICKALAKGKKTMCGQLRSFRLPFTRG